MDSFELNKVTASFLTALLIAMIGSLLSDHLLRPIPLEKPALIIEGVEEEPKSGGKSADIPLKPITPLLASASVERGQGIAKKCTQCHTFDKGGPNRTGPNLWGVIGSKLAYVTTFAYSSSFKSKGGNWDSETLNTFLHKPRAFVSGTKMSFVGLKDEQDRADLIAYLHTLSDNPAPLPSAPQGE